MVIPLTCVAAIPVDAVMDGIMPCRFKYLMYALTVYVFPDPGSPVRKTFAPVLSISSAVSCVMLSNVQVLR